MIENIFRGFIGVVVLLAICFLLSNARKSINWRLVAGGLFLQGALAILILATPFGGFVEWISGGFVKLLGYSDVGAMDIVFELGYNFFLG